MSEQLDPGAEAHKPESDEGLGAGYTPGTSEELFGVVKEPPPPALDRDEVSGEIAAGELKRRGLTRAALDHASFMAERGLGPVTEEPGSAAHEDLGSHKDHPETEKKIGRLVNTQGMLEVRRASDRSHDGSAADGEEGGTAA